MNATIQNIRVAHNLLHQIVLDEQRRVEAGQPARLPPLGRYRIYQLIRDLSGPVEDSTRLLVDLAARHVERDEQGVVYVDQEGGRVPVIRDPLALQQDERQALSVEVEIKTEPLRASELGAALEVISPAVLAALGDLFEWDVES